MQAKQIETMTTSQATELFKKSLKADSKWFSQDVRDFKERYAKMTPAQKEECANRLQCFESKAYSQKIAAETKQMANHPGFMQLGGKYALS